MFFSKISVLLAVTVVLNLGVLCWAQNPVHCLDKYGGKYSIGQSWTDMEECVRFDCEVNPGTGGAFTVATMCAKEQNIDKKKCLLQKQIGPFPMCCPKWRCFGGPNLKTIIQEKLPGAII